MPEANKGGSTQADAQAPSRGAARSRKSRRLAARRRQIALVRWAAGLALGLLAIFVVFRMSGTAANRPATYVNPEPSSTAASPELPTFTPNPTAAQSAAPTPTADASPSPSATLRSATIRSLGDFVIHEAILKSAYAPESQSFDFSPMFTMVSGVMGDATYTVANVEGAMCGPGEEGYAGYPRFNTPVELMQAMVDNGVDMLTLSNNHALDYYFKGLTATIENCEKHNLAFVGAARTRQERDTPVIKDIGGIKVGFLNYTTGTNGLEKYCNSAVREYAICYAGRADFKADVRRLRSAGAEVVIAYIHWGSEYERSADSTQCRLARKLAAAGVDAIIGSHPHVVQPATWIEAKQSDGTVKRCLCAYSLGNFISNQPERYRDTGIVFEFSIRETQPGMFEIQSPQYIPTYYWRRGNEQKGLLIRIVACGQWLDARPEGMNEKAYARMKQAWREAVDLVGTEVAQPSAG